MVQRSCISRTQHRLLQRLQRWNKLSRRWSIGSANPRRRSSSLLRSNDWWKGSLRTCSRTARYLEEWTMARLWRKRCPRLTIQTSSLLSHPNQRPLSLGHQEPILIITRTVSCMRTKAVSITRTTTQSGLPPKQSSTLIRPNETQSKLHHSKPI